MVEEKKKQLKLNNFCTEFDVPRSTALLWINSKDFPAYKISGRWYIDVDGFYEWRKIMTESELLLA